MNEARTLASATVFQGSIYITGGVTKTDWRSTLTPVELYNPTLDEWKQLQPIDIPGARHVIIESNGFLYAFGGMGKVPRKFVPCKNVWTAVLELNSMMVNHTL